MYGEVLLHRSRSRQTHSHTLLTTLASSPKNYPHGLTEPPLSLSLSFPLAAALHLRSFTFSISIAVFRLSTNLLFPAVPRRPWDRFAAFYPSPSRARGAHTDLRAFPDFPPPSSWVSPVPLVLLQTVSPFPFIVVIGVFYVSEANLTAIPAPAKQKAQKMSIGTFLADEST